MCAPRCARGQRYSRVTVALSDEGTEFLQLREDSAWHGLLDHKSTGGTYFEEVVADTRVGKGSCWVPQLSPPALVVVVAAEEEEDLEMKCGRQEMTGVRQEMAGVDLRLNALLASYQREYLIE